MLNYNKMEKKSNVIEDIFVVTDTMNTQILMVTSTANEEIHVFHCGILISAFVRSNL